MKHKLPKYHYVLGILLAFFVSSCSTFKSAHKCPTGKSNVSAKKFKSNQKKVNRPIEPVVSIQSAEQKKQHTENGEGEITHAEAEQAKEEKQPIKLPIFQSVSKKETTILESSEQLSVDGNTTSTKKISKRKARKLAIIEQQRKEREELNTQVTTALISKVRPQNTPEKLSKEGEGYSLNFYASPKAKREIRRIMTTLHENVRFVPLHDVFLDQEKAEETLLKVRDVLNKYPEVNASFVGLVFDIETDPSTEEVFLFGKSKAVYDQVLTAQHLDVDYLAILAQHNASINSEVRVGDLIRARGNAMRAFLIEHGIAPERLGIVMGEFRAAQ